MSSLMDSLLSLPLMDKVANYISPLLTTNAFHILDNDLVQLYLNPLYLVPIGLVTFLGLLVYAFGFKSTTSTPPTLHLFVDENDKKFGRKADKKRERKEERKEAKSSTHNKPQLTNGSLSSKPKSGNAGSGQQQQQQQQKKKSKQVEKDASIPLGMATDDDTGGEWAPVLSRKEKKNRKMKEVDNNGPEKKLAEKETEATPVNQKNSGKNKKSGKDVKDAVENLETSPAVNPVVNGEQTPEKESPKLISIEPQPITPIIDELAGDEHHEYELAKEPRGPKKKKTQPRKKISESEILASVSEKVPIEEPELVSKPKEDKLTATIIANYETGPKSKKKNKKKGGTEEFTDGEAKLTVDQVPDIPSEPSVVEEPQVKEEEFKVATSKKRRARRE